MKSRLLYLTVALFLALMLLCFTGCETTPDADTTGTSDSLSSGPADISEPSDIPQVPSENDTPLSTDSADSETQAPSAAPDFDESPTTENSDINSEPATTPGNQENTTPATDPIPSVQETEPSPTPSEPSTQETIPSTEPTDPPVQETVPSTEATEPPIQETEPVPVPTDPSEPETAPTEPTQEETTPPATEGDPYKSVSYLDANGTSVDPGDPNAVAICTMEFDEQWNLLHWTEVSLDGSITFKEIHRRYNSANAEIYNSECYYNQDGTFSHWDIYEYHEDYQTPDNWFPTRQAHLDAAGKVITEKRWSYYSEQYGRRQQSFAAYTGDTLLSLTWYHETNGAVASYETYDLDGTLTYSVTYYESGAEKTQFSRNESGFTSSVEYREDGQLIRAVDYDPTIDRYCITEYTYYPSGAVESITVTDWDGKKTVTNYSEDGQVIEPRYIP